MSAQASCKGYQYVHTVPAYRPRRRRTKTGCVGCRLRRKKCDERKPICRGCESRQLACAWTEGELSSPEHGAGAAQSKRSKVDQEIHGVVYATSDDVEASASPQAEELLSASLVQPTAKDSVEEILQTAHASTLLEHFISRTSHILACRDAHRNPWLYSILPMAHCKPLVMHAVLAISGVHFINYKPLNGVEQATYAHYGQAVKQLNDQLATWVCDGKEQDTLYLFLAANLLIMYELVDGDSNGNLAHHIRACSEFAKHVVARGHPDADHDLIGFSLENYVYSALLACLAEPASNESCERSTYHEDLLSMLRRVRGYRTFGSLLGCAYSLYELIPEIARYVWCPKRRTKDCQYHDSLAAYKLLEHQIVSWSKDNVKSTSASAQCSTAEYANGVMIRNSLLMLLRFSWIRNKDEYHHAMDNEIQPLIDDNMLLEELLADSPLVSVSLWPMMITGSMIRKNEQRLNLARRLKAHHTQAPVTATAVRVLNWLWNDSDGESHGPEALTQIARKYGTRICLA